MKRDKARTLAKNMRKVALFIQDNADDIPDDIKIEMATHLWSWDVSNDVEITGVIGKAMRAGMHDGADIRKDYSDSYFRCYLTWGIDEPKVTWKIVTGRDEVCTKNVVGVHKVMKMVAPEGDWTETEVEEEIVEWECHSLLKVTDEAS